MISITNINEIKIIRKKIPFNNLLSAILFIISIKMISSEEKNKIKDLEKFENLKPSPDGHKNIFEKFKEALNI